MMNQGGSSVDYDDKTAMDKIIIRLPSGEDLSNHNGQGPWWPWRTAWGQAWKEKECGEKW